jgi:hypothetical protein
MIRSIDQLLNYVQFLDSEEHLLHNLSTAMILIYNQVICDSAL